MESVSFTAPGICRRARRAVIGRRRRAADRHVPRDHARAAALFRAGEALQRCASCGGRGDIAASCICVLYFGPHCPETGLKAALTCSIARCYARSRQFCTIDIIERLSTVSRFDFRRLVCSPCTRSSRRDFLAIFDSRCAP